MVDLAIGWLLAQPGVSCLLVRSHTRNYRQLLWHDASDLSLSIFARRRSVHRPRNKLGATPRFRWCQQRCLSSAVRRPSDCV